MVNCSQSRVGRTVAHRGQYLEPEHRLGRGAVASPLLDGQRAADVGMPPHLERHRVPPAVPKLDPHLYNIVRPTSLVTSG